MADLTVYCRLASDGGGRRGQGDLRARAARPPPRPDRRGQPDGQRGRQPRRRTGPRGRRGRPTRRPRAATTGRVRCTGCRTRSRTPTRSAGWRTTFGSPLRADYVPRRDELIVERIRGAGAVTIGKTNVPEWAAGSHTFNPIFGTTRNPYDLSRSAGGSQRGRRRRARRRAWCRSPTAATWAARCATRPRSATSSGCGPVVGRVPAWPTTNAWELTSVGGPMARNVEDLALLLSVIAGPTTRARLSLETPGRDVRATARGHALAGVRVALSTDLGGAFEVDHAGRRRIVRRRAPCSPSAGAPRRGRAPDVTAPSRLPHAAGLAVPRPLRHAAGQAPRRFKASLADNIRAGASLTGDDVAAAYRRMTSLAEKVRRVLRAYDVLVLRSARCRRSTPRGVPGRDQRQAAGDLSRLDALGLPDHRHRLPGDLGAGRIHQRGLAGRHADRAAPRHERRLLEVAYAFEQATRVGDRRPGLGGERMSEPPDPDRHRHRRHVHRRRRGRRGDRRARHHQDAVDAADPAVGFMAGVDKVLADARPRRRRGDRRVATARPSPPTSCSRARSRTSASSPPRATRTCSRSPGSRCPTATATPTSG